MGLGSFWDPNDHPRGWHGRFAKKWKISDALRGILDHFSPRTFQSDSQAGQYAFNLGHKNGPFSSVELTRLRKDWDEASDHLRAGDMDPQTKAFDDMMQSHMHPTTEGLIATTTFGPDALGLRPDQMRDGPGGITDLFGTVIGNKGYQAVHLGNDVTAGQHGAGKISATILVPAGTKAAFPGQSPNDRGFFLDKEQPLLITRVDPDGMGGWRIAAVAEPHPGTGSSEVSQDLNPGRKGVGLTPEERAARLTQPSTMPAPAAPPAAPATEAVMRPESVQAPAVGRTAEQEAARVQRAQAGRQANVNEGNPPVQAPLPTPNPREAPAPPPAAGPPSPTGVPARNEPIHAPSIGGTGTEGKSASEIANTPAPAPEAPPVLSPAEQGKSLRDAYMESGIESPSTGPHRAAFNRAYLNAKRENGHPDQALRDLETDIKRAQEGLDSGQDTSPTLADDIKSMNGLADLIATHYGLPRGGKKQEEAPKSPVQRTGGPDEFLGEKKPGAREAAGVSGQPSKTATGLTPHEQAGSGPGTAGVGGRKEGAPETPAPRGSSGKTMEERKSPGTAAGKTAAEKTMESQARKAGEDATGIRKMAKESDIPGDGGGLVGDAEARLKEGQSPEEVGKWLDQQATKLSDDAAKEHTLKESDNLETKSRKREMVQEANANADKLRELADRVRGKGPEGPAASPSLEERQTADSAGVDRVLKAYNDIVARGDGHDRRVSIADLRAEVGQDLSRTDLTRALREIGRGGSGHGGLLSRGVKPDARTEANGMDMGGEKVHFLQLPRPGEKERGKETTPHAPEAPTPEPVKAAVKAAPKAAGPKPEAVDAAKKAYEDIVARRGPEGDRKVALQDIRQELQLQHNFDRSEVDAALKELGRGGSGHGGLISGTNAPSAREKAGAMKMGGEDVHFLQLPRPGEAGRGGETTPNAPEAPTPEAPAAAAEKPLEKMTKAELLAHPDAEGAKKSWTKDRIKQHIEDRQGIRSAVAKRPKATEKPTTTLAEDLQKAGVGEITGSQAEKFQKAMEGPDTRESLLERADALQNAADNALERSIRLGTKRGEDGALLPSTENQVQSRQEGADAAQLEKAAQALRQRADVGHVSDLSTDPQERQKQIIDRVNKAYEDLKGKSPSGLVRLADLRDRIGSDVSREELDRLLGHLMQLPEVNLSPDSNQKFATARERAAATHFGNQRQDLLHIRNGVTAEDLHTGVAHIQAGGHPEEAPGHKRLVAEEKRLHGARAIRPAAPINNEPRANEFTKAWDAAGIPEAPGSAGRSMKEIRKDVAEGKIDPTEGIRRMESEISFNKDELSQVEADLRAPDLTDKQRAELQAEHAKISEGIKAQEKASEFMRAHFGGKGDAPTVAEVKDKLPATFGDQIRAAKPEEMDEVARIQGLDTPKGDTAEEKFDDLIRQTVQKELDSRQAAKVDKAAKAEAARIKKEAREAGKAEFRPGGERHLDATKIAEGIGLDENNSYLNDAQAELNDGKTPKQVADRLRFMARGLSDSNAIIHGSVVAGNETPDDKMHRETKLAEGRAAVAKLEELAKRIEESKRPRKPRAPSTKLTPTDHAAAKEAAKATGTPVAEVRSAMEDAKKADAKLQELGIPTSADELHARAIARSSAPFNDAKTAEEARRAATAMHADLTLAEIRKMGAEHGITGRSKKDITDKIIARRFPAADEPVTVRPAGPPTGFAIPPQPAAGRVRDAGRVPGLSERDWLSGGQFDQLKAGDAIEVHLGGSKTRKDSVAKVDPDGTLHTKGGYKYAPSSDVQVSKAGAPSAPSAEAVRQAQIGESETKLKAAARADELQRAKQASEVVSEVHELVANGASAQAIRQRLGVVGAANQVDTGELQDLADNPKELLKAADAMGASAGLTRVGNAGSTVRFKNGTHEAAGALEVQNGTPARVTRPGHTAKLSNGETVTISRPKAHPVSAEPGTPGKPARLSPTKQAAKKALPQPQASVAGTLAALSNHENPPTREEAHGMIEHFTRDELLDAVKQLGIPVTGSKTKENLRREIVDATVGRRLDSIATRGFKGDRPDSAPAVLPEESRAGQLARLAAAKKAAKGTGPAAEPRLSPAAEKARLEQERADNMARLAAAKAVKKAAPAKAAPAKKAATKVAAGEARIEPGKFSDKPFREQTWGGRAQPGDLRYHESGVIGSALDMMGQDQRLDVGGEPLRNVLGQIATDVNRGTITPAQGLERYKALAARLPRDTKARQELERAIQRIDSPPRKPNLPEGTPDYIRKLAEKLAEIPIARQAKVGNSDRKGELDQVEELARELTNGEPKSIFTAHAALEKLLDNRHESGSDSGSMQIMDAIQAALKDDEAARQAARKARQAQKKE